MKKIHKKDYQVKQATKILVKYAANGLKNHML